VSIRDEKVLIRTPGRSLTEVTVTYEDQVRREWVTVERHVVYEVSCDACGESLANLDQFSHAVDAMTAAHDCEVDQ
jgi:hypothetical protein